MGQRWRGLPFSCYGLVRSKCEGGKESCKRHVEDVVGYNLTSEIPEISASVTMQWKWKLWKLCKKMQQMPIEGKKC